MPLIKTLIKEEMDRIHNERGQQRFANGHFPQAAQLFEEFSANESLADFLTLKAYEQLD